jgi:hypothetical protein
LEQLATIRRAHGDAKAAGQADLTAAITHARASQLMSDKVQREAHALHVMAVLRRLRREGFFQDAKAVDALRSDPAFELLRDRPDFAEILKPEKK